MSDFSVALPADMTTRLAAVCDVEGKIPRAFDALGPLAGLDVLLVDDGGPDSIRARQLTDLGARLRVSGPSEVAKAVAGASTDTIVSCWSWFRNDLPADLEIARRALRPGGRLLVLHDYGRDDVSGLRSPDLPEYTQWSRRDGWFLRSGFKVRVIHCWWTFESIDEAAAFLGAAFEDVGRTVGAGLKRPRLSYNVAIYHWTDGGAPS